MILHDYGWQLCGLCHNSYFLYYRLFERVLSIPELFDSYRWLCSWEHFECASRSFLVHFSVHLYFPSLANGSLWFWFKLFRFYGKQVFFSLSLMLFYEWNGDLFNSCFVRDFALLGVVHVGVVEATCFLLRLPHWISPHSQLVDELVIFSGAPETLPNHSLPTGSISPQVFYIYCLNWL